MTRNAAADWPTIERDYREGDLSVRALADWHRVSEAAIRKRAKAGGWTRRDDAPKAPVRKREIAVTYAVARTVASVASTSPAEIMDRGLGLVVRLLDELDATTSRLGDLEVAIAEATEGDETTKRVEALMRAVSLPSRAGVLKTLATAAKTLAEARAGAPQGKKAAAEEAAQTAGQGTAWGDDLMGPVN